MIFFITDPRYTLAQTVSALQAAASALPKGSLFVQFRDKNASFESFRTTARSLRGVTRALEIPLVVNGSVDVALEVEADGVHLPNRSPDVARQITEARLCLGEAAFVTTSAHSAEDVVHVLAAKARTNAILVSPIFGTPGKGTPRGVIALTQARSLVQNAPARCGSAPLLLALGGVNAENAKACAKAGADGIAAIRAIYDGEARALHDALAGAPQLPARWPFAHVNDTKTRPT